MRNKQQVRAYILDYLKKVTPNFVKKRDMFTCLKCGNQTANIFPPNSHKVHCVQPGCGGQGDIFDICRRIEFDNNPDVPDEDIGKYLIDMFSIQTDKHIDGLFEKFVKWGWDLVGNEANTKKSNREKKWENKNHKNPCNWDCLDYYDAKGYIEQQFIKSCFDRREGHVICRIGYF